SLKRRRRISICMKTNTTFMTAETVPTDHDEAASTTAGNVEIGAVPIWPCTLRAIPTDITKTPSKNVAQRVMYPSLGTGEVKVVVPVPSSTTSRGLSSGIGVPRFKGL